MARQTQLSLLKSETKAYGGLLLNTRKGRQRGRPLDTKNSIHLVLKSSQATGDWSFRKPKNSQKVRGIINKFAQKNGIKILSLAVVGNHIHLHLKLTNRFTYFPFIRAVTAAIAMAITGVSRWSSVTAKGSRLQKDSGAIGGSRSTKDLSREGKKKSRKFWDYRPFTRVVIGYRAFLGIKDYIRINQMEGCGYTWLDAKMLQAYEHDRRHRDTG